MATTTGRSGSVGGCETNPLAKYLLSNSKKGSGSLLMDHGPLQPEPIRVCLRLRPITKFELNRRSVDCCRITATTTTKVASAGHKSSNSTSSQYNSGEYYENENSTTTASNSTTENDNCIHIHSPLDGRFQFAFDKVFPADTNNSTTQQMQVYQHAVAPLALHAMEGYSCACIAYGQTGSGKTYTMMGGGGVSFHSSSASSTTKTNHITNKAQQQQQHPGMIPQFIKHIFQLIQDSPSSIEYIVRCSFVEIYLERILDLLNPSNRSVCICSSSNF